MRNIVRKKRTARYNQFDRAIEYLRKYIGPRNEHHAICGGHRRLRDAGKHQCDCYAHDRDRAHEALDCLEREINNAKEMPDELPS